MQISNDISWWGEYQVPHEHTGFWKIGPLSLYIQRLFREWRLSYDVGRDAFEAGVVVEIPYDTDAATADTDRTSRFAVSDTSESVLLSPVLPDRPLITRSEKPLNVLSQERTTVYASVPLWVKIQVGESKKILTEIPIFRPTDTWFGTNTLEGQLCYASRSYHRVRLSQVPVLPHRATTEVTVRNLADTMLSLERMLIAVPHLSLYYSADGAIWTDDLILERLEADNFAAFRTRARETRDGTSDRVESIERICEPREVSRENLVVRAFSSLFKHGDETF
jgi:hypothetical protein